MILRAIALRTIQTIFRNLNKAFSVFGALIRSHRAAIWLRIGAASLVRRLTELPANIRRNVAISVSVSVHFCLLLLFLLQALPGGGNAGGVGQAAGASDGSGMDVVLTSVGRLEAVTLKEVEPEELDEALIRFDALPTLAISDIAIEKVDDQLIAKDSGVLGDADTLQEHGGASGTQADFNGNSAYPAETMRALWKAIEPCWKRLADKNTAGVTMHVSFTQLGNPSLASPGAAAYDADLKNNQSPAELLAADALAECGPYLMVYGQNNVQIAFPAGG